MGKYLIDTNQIIDFLKGKPDITDIIANLLKNGDMICACAITIAETYAGCRKKEKKLTGTFLNLMEYFEINFDTSQLAGEIIYHYRKKGITLSVTDSLIASVAIKNKAVLITSNKKHFPMENLRMLEISR
ncbi:MAG: type II toxin-antitoxin system VapC family toxin [Candidatus Eremiobacteraeota bacterium]|nr:type II toxin-antitoxin system VapC family toxin [Candidatus Eremiobacteraeota bacterium]